jgi:hypothetical protein
MTDHVSPLNETETEITRTVVREFQANWTPTARKLLVREYGSAPLIRLINASVLKKTEDQKGLLPMLLAFEYCGDPHQRAFAKRSVEMVTRAAISLYEGSKDDDPIKLSPQDLDTAVSKTLASTAMELGLVPGEPERVVRLGLYLLKEFHIFGWERVIGDPDQLTVRFVLLDERIIDQKKTIETMWGEFVQQTSRDLWASSGVAQREPVAESRNDNRLLMALRAFCKDEVFENSLVRAHSKRPPKMKPSAAFELYVSWLLGLFGWSTVLLGEYEKIVGDETNVERASVDILATSQSQKLVLLVVACTLGTPKHEDFDNLRHAREILLREYFGETFAQIIPVVFTTVMGGAKYDYIEDPVTIAIVDADRLKELFALVKSGGGDTDLLIFLNSLTDLAARAEFSAQI